MYACYIFKNKTKLVQEWAAGNIGHNTQYEDKQNKIHNTNIENRRDNQEWAAVNIGHNTQHDDKQNKIHNTNIENRIYCMCNIN
jgi:hypothetical protein